MTLRMSQLAKDPDRIAIPFDADGIILEIDTYTGEIACYVNTIRDVGTPMPLPNYATSSSASPSTHARRRHAIEPLRPVVREDWEELGSESGVFMLLRTVRALARHVAAGDAVRQAVS